MREIERKRGIEMSVRQFARESGGAVSHTLLQSICNGEYATRAPGQRVLDSLAEMLELPVKVIEAAAGAPPSYGPFQLDDDAARLTPAQRKAVKHVVEVMLNPGVVEATVTLLPAAARDRKPRSRRT
jgi:hypothetical protein